MAQILTAHKDWGYNAQHLFANVPPQGFITLYLHHGKKRMGFYCSKFCRRCSCRGLPGGGLPGNVRGAAYFLHICAAPEQKFVSGAFESYFLENALARPPVPPPSGLGGIRFRPSLRGILKLTCSRPVCETGLQPCFYTGAWMRSVIALYA